MAKRRQPGAPRSVTEQPKRRSVMVPQSVADIRRRFNLAIRYGYTSDEATVFANEGMDPPPKKKGTAAVQPAEPASPPSGADASTPTQVQSISGSGTTTPPPGEGEGDQKPVTIDPDSLPKNWQEDMGWPDMRDLAATTQGGRKPTSKRMAITWIEDAILAHMEAQEKEKENRQITA